MYLKIEKFTDVCITGDNDVCMTGGYNAYHPGGILDRSRGLDGVKSCLTELRLKLEIFLI